MSESGLSLLGRTAIVTGASSGIGSAIAAALAKAGAVVFAASRSGSIPAAVEGHEAKVFPVRLDVRDENAIRDLVARAVTETGSVNIMVNNAGLNYPNTILEGHAQHWREMFETNVLGVLAGAQAAIHAMRAGGFSGHIVKISSIAGRREGAGVYGATKAAVNMIGESLRLELQNDPIRIVQIVPGPVMTNFGRHYPAALVNGLLQAFGEPPIFVAGQTLPAAAIAQFQDRARAVFASADDIARTVLFAVTQPIDLDLFEIVVRPGKDLPIGETVSGSGP